jgi:hypothetical protein
VKRLIPVEATSAATIHQLGQIAEGVVKKGFETEDGRGLKVGLAVVDVDSYSGQPGLFWFGLGRVWAWLGSAWVQLGGDWEGLEEVESN